MEIIIVTGMSGAGKSTAINCFEDMEYYCVDNLPPALVPNFVELVSDRKQHYNKVVLGIDIRGGSLFDDLFISLSTLEERGFHYQIIFFDCEDDVLVKRYKETRRLHPLAKNERINEGIQRERAVLSKVKDRASYIIDTTHILPKHVKDLLRDMYTKQVKFNSLMITVLVFGFKYGIPIDADLVFDVRFIPNPYYDMQLRPMTGNEQPVRDFVMKQDITPKFLAKLEDMIEFLVPEYEQEGKNQLVVAIGCTGGKHRSVVVGNVLQEHLKQLGHAVTIEYRDIDKDSKRGK